LGRSDSVRKEKNPCIAARAKSTVENLNGQHLGCTSHKKEGKRIGRKGESIQNQVGKEIRDYGHKPPTKRYRLTVNGKGAGGKVIRGLPSNTEGREEVLAIGMQSG